MTAQIVTNAIAMASLLVVAFVAGRETVPEPTQSELTIAAALDALADESLITLEERETIWREYATKVRAS